MITRFVIHSLICILCFASSPALAGKFNAPEDKVFTIFMLLWRGSTDLENGFMAFLKDAGISARFVIRDAQRDEAKLKGFIAEAKAQKPDLIYTFGTTVTLATVGSINAIDPNIHITDIPVVYTAVADPAHVGLSAAENTTGRNLTGVSHVVPLPLQLQTIHRLDQFKRVGFLYNAQEANSRAAFEAFVPLANDMGFEVHAAPIPLNGEKPDPAQIPALIARLAGDQVELVYLPSDSFVAANAADIVNQIHQHHMVSFAATEPPIRDAGALIGIVSRYYTVGRLAGLKAKQILVDRVPAGQIPMEPISRYSFLVNLDSAHRLNYYPPVTVLEYAEIVSASQR